MTSSAALDFAAWLRPGDTVIWGQAHAEPLTLTRALMAQRQAVQHLRPRLLLGIPSSDTVRPEHGDAFDFISYCGTGANRALAKAGLLDVLPVPYSQIPALLRGGPLKVDVVLVQVSPADAHGHHSLGLGNDLLVAALDVARVVIAEVNEAVPWTHGVRTLHAHQISLCVPAQCAPLVAVPEAPSPTDLAIARRVAALIGDGATLQMGLGGTADATLQLLTDRRDLGIHSGLVGDGLVALAESGALTNARKTIDRGVSIAGLLVGSARLQRHAHRNPALQLRGSEYTHGADVLRQIDHFVALNAAIEIDLSGQINAEVAGGQYVGAVGGAPDFLRAAHLSRGGLPIVALPATAGARSRIVARLSGPVSTPRCDAGLIVTEFGVADLRGLTINQRRRRLLDIAHPDHQEALERLAHGDQPAA